MEDLNIQCSTHLSHPPTGILIYIWTHWRNGVLNTDSFTGSYIFPCRVRLLPRINFWM